MAPAPARSLRRAAIGPAQAAGRRAIRERRPDVVIATAPPWTALLAGARLAADARVPFVADLRDPWIGNPCSRPLTRLGRALAPLIERRCLRRASLIVANTGPLAAHLAGRHPDLAGRIVTVPNGPDEDAEFAPGGDGEERPGYGGRPGEWPLAVVHTGTLYGGRDPRPILRAVRDLFEGGALSPADLRIEFVGPCDVGGFDPRAAAAESRNAIVFRPPVARPEAQRIARAADVLLLLQPEAPLQLPAKVFEYLGAGREVLTVAGAGATADFARETALGPVAASGDPAAIATALLDLVRRKRSGALRRPRPEAVARFRPERLVGELARAIEGVLGVGTRVPAGAAVPAPGAWRRVLVLGRHAD